MDPKLEQAVQAIKSGDKAAGLVLLAQVIRSDPNNESAWIWMATAQDDPEKKKQCLERVLRINPGNERIRRALTVLYPPVVAVEPAPPAVAIIPETPPVQPEQPVETQASATTPETVEVPSPLETQVETTPLETQPAATEPAPAEVAGPDLSWLKETPAVSEGTQEEAPDLAWLKEDLPSEEPDKATSSIPEAAPAESVEPLWQKENLPSTEPDTTKEEPSPDLSWLKEDQPAEQATEASFAWPAETEAEAASSDMSWLKEETPAAVTKPPEAGIPPSPTGETDDLAWLRAASAGPVSDISSVEKSMPASSGETDFSWLRSEPAGEEKAGAESKDEPVFPWLNEEAAPTEGQAVKNEDESIPDWLRSGPDAAAEPVSPISFEKEPLTPTSSQQESPTLESEPLRPEDLDAITSRHAELPFTWDEVTGEPVLKTPSEAPEGTTPEEAAGSDVTPPAGTSDIFMAQTDQQAGVEPAGPSISMPISRPRSAVAATTAAGDDAAAKPAQKKGMSRGQIVLLTLLGLATLIILAAFAVYLAVNLGWLKAFGF